MEKLRTPFRRSPGNWDKELEIQRYWLVFCLTLNQAIGLLISSEKRPLGLPPSRRKLLINPLTQATEKSGQCESDSLFCHCILRPCARIRSIDTVIALIKLSVLTYSSLAPGSPVVPPSLRCFLRTPPSIKLPTFVIPCRKFGNECSLYVFSCKQLKSPFRHSARPFIHTQEKELIDFEVKCWHLLLFKTRTSAPVIHRALPVATSVRQMKTSCCQMRNAK